MGRSRWELVAHRGHNLRNGFGHRSTAEALHSLARHPTAGKLDGGSNLPLFKAGDMAAWAARFANSFIPERPTFSQAPPLETVNGHIVVAAALGPAAREYWQASLRKYKKFGPSQAAPSGSHNVPLPIIQTIMLKDIGNASEEFLPSLWKQPSSHKVAGSHRSRKDFIQRGEGSQQSIRQSSGPISSHWGCGLGREPSRHAGPMHSTVAPTTDETRALAAADQLVCPQPGLRRSARKHPKLMAIHVGF